MEEHKEWLRRHLRLVIFTGSYNYIRDGVAVTLNRLVDYLEAQGIAVLVVAPTAGEPAFQHSGELVPVPSIPIPGRGEYRLALGLPAATRRRIEAFAPTLFHVAVPDLLGRRALRYGRRHRIPTVASYHTRYETYLKYYGIGFATPLVRRYLTGFYNRCRQLYAPSEAIVRLLRREGVRTDIRVWSRGVDADRFQPAHRSAAWREAIGVGADEVLVTYVGRLVREKNMAAVTGVFAALNERAPNCRTMIVGSGPEEARVRAALPDTIFAGFLYDDDLARAYASSDLFFFPSTTETFGNVTAEAMASGLPALCADAPNSDALVIPGETGFLAATDDTEAFVDLARRLARDCELRQRMGANARRHVLETFATETVMDSLLGYYLDALAQDALTGTARQPSAAVEGKDLA